MIPIDTVSYRTTIRNLLHGLTAEVDGAPVTLTGHATIPPAIQPWDAWPVFTEARPFTIAMSEVDFSVNVALPGTDPDTTIAAGDALIGQVAEALMSVGKINAVRPARWIVGEGADIPVLVYEITV